MRRLLFASLIAFGLVLAVVATSAQAATAYVTDYSAVAQIGDSLTYQAGAGDAKMTQLDASVGWTTERVDGVKGRPITRDCTAGPGSLTLLRSWRANGFDAGTYVIALGTNNKNATVAFWRQQIGLLMTEIGPQHTVYWVGMAFRDNASDPRALAFQQVLATTPGVIALDWNAYVHSISQTGLWSLADPNGEHMTTAGYAVRNAWISAHVQPAVTAFPGGTPNGPLIYQPGPVPVVHRVPVAAPVGVPHR